MEGGSPRATGPAGPEMLARLLDCHGAALELYARQLCECPEDCVQEPLVELSRQAELPDDVVPWLYRVVRNKAISAARSARRRRHREREVVGRVIADIMTKQLETIVQLPDVPNLYWTLTALPHPVVDVRKAVQFEELAVYLAFPEFQEARRGGHPPEVWQQLLDGVLAKYRGVASLAFDEKPPKLPASKDFVDQAYPTARQGLIARGATKEEVDMMLPAQVVLLHVIATYEELRDECFKWFHVPYWQAHEGIQKTEQDVKTTSRQREVLPLASMLNPAIARAQFSIASAERRLAALRCIEAIRLYAAIHDRKLPERLGDISWGPLL